MINTNLIRLIFRKTNFELKVDLFYSSGIFHRAAQGTPHTLSFTKSTAEEAGTCQWGTASCHSGESLFAFSHIQHFIVPCMDVAFPSSFSLANRRSHNVLAEEVFLHPCVAVWWDSLSHLSWSHSCHHACQGRLEWRSALSDGLLLRPAPHISKSVWQPFSVIQTEVLQDTIHERDTTASYKKTMAEWKDFIGE